MTINSNRLAGTAYLTVNGVSLMLAGDFAYAVGKVERETLTGMDTVHGFSEKPKTPHISGTLRDSYGTSVASLNSMDSETVTVELANGKVIIGRGMWTVGDQEVKSTDATIEVKWEGPQGSVTEN